MIAQTPQPPYYAVIFCSTLAPDQKGYELMANKMLEMASEQQGFLGIESVRNNDAFQFGITISYWKDLSSITDWKAHSKHMVAQQYGKEMWYSSYKVRIAKVERDYQL